MTVHEVKIGGWAAKGRNGFFNARRICIWPGFPLYAASGPDPDEKSPGLRIEVESKRPGFQPPIVFMTTQEEAIELAQALFAAAGQTLVTWVDESDLARRYDEACCPQCQAGLDCPTDHTAGATYYALPETERKRLVEGLADDFGLPRFGDVVHDTIGDFVADDRQRLIDGQGESIMDNALRYGLD